MKPNAFMPNVNSVTGKPETSVYQVSGASEDEIWAIGKGVVALSGRTLYGCAMLKVEDIKRAGLSLLADNNPPRHANIVGWPDVKSEQKLFAERLAGAAKLILL